MPEASGAAGAVFVGHYELAVELAKSQLGALWVARAPSASGTAWFCVRRVRTGPPLSSEDARRVHDAAHASLAARHPSLVSVLDVVPGEHELGIVSEYVECEPMRSLQRLPSFRRKPLSVHSAVLVAADLLEGLEVLRAQIAAGSAWPSGVWGGLSPDSVILGTDGRARVADLGVAGVLKNLPKFGSHPDLAAYAAPEQLAHATQVDERAEVFALGILLWELLTARRLFSGATHAAVAEKVQSAEIPRLDGPKALTAQAVPGRVADIVARAVERDPRQRFQTLAEMRSAVEQVLPNAEVARATFANELRELLMVTLAARAAALSQRGSAPSMTAKPGVVLSSAPPKAKRPLQRTLLGVAPPEVASPSVRPVSGPPAHSDIPVPPSQTAQTRRVRSPTLIGVAPPAIPPAADARTVQQFDLDQFQTTQSPSGELFANPPGAAPADPLGGFNALLSNPPGRGPTPSLESPSAFDFMADRLDDNVATVRRDVEFDANHSPHAPAGAFPENQASARTQPIAQPTPASDHAATVPRPMPSSFPEKPWSEPAPERMTPHEDPLATRVMSPAELPMSDAERARRQRLRRVVMGIVAGTFGLLIVALLITAWRRSKNDEQAASEPSANPTPAASSSAAANAAPFAPVASASAAAGSASKSRANAPFASQTEAGRSATPQHVVISNHTGVKKPAPSIKPKPKPVPGRKLPSSSSAAKKAAAGSKTKPAGSKKPLKPVKKSTSIKSSH